jgi:hypothetical protein
MPATYTLPLRVVIIAAFVFASGMGRLQRRGAFSGERIISVYRHWKWRQSGYHSHPERDARVQVAEVTTQRDLNAGAAVSRRHFS